MAKPKALQGMSTASQHKGNDSISKRNKSRLQEYLDSQNAMNEDYDENQTNLENDQNAQQRAKVLKVKNKVGSEFDNDLLNR